MAWDIHARRTDALDDRATQVKARWTSLGSIEDVSLDCGHGVHAVGVTALARRQMNAFSKPIEGVFRWDSDVEQPEAVLTWIDGREQCQETIPLTGSVQHRVRTGGL